LTFFDEKINKNSDPQMEAKSILKKADTNIKKVFGSSLPIPVIIEEHFLF
jgi:hypothetical protein